jgi:hypothetical protein
MELFLVWLFVMYADVGIHRTIAADEPVVPHYDAVPGLIGIKGPVRIESETEAAPHIPLAITVLIGIFQETVDVEDSTAVLSETASISVDACSVRKIYRPQLEVNNVGGRDEDARINPFRRVIKDRHEQRFIIGIYGAYWKLFHFTFCGEYDGYFPYVAENLTAVDYRQADFGWGWGWKTCAWPHRSNVMNDYGGPLTSRHNSAGYFGLRSHFCQLSLDGRQCAVANNSLRDTYSSRDEGEYGDPDRSGRGSTRRAILGGFLFAFGAALMKLAFYFGDTPRQQGNDRWLTCGAGCCAGLLIAQGTVLVLTGNWLP